MSVLNGTHQIMRLNYLLFSDPYNIRDVGQFGTET